MDGHSRFNSAHFAPGVEISSRGIARFDIRKVVVLLPHTRTKNR